MTLCIDHPTPGSESNAGQIYRIPRLLESWPYDRKENKFFAEIRSASDAWILGSGILDKNDVLRFKREDFALYASLLYPTANPEEFRVCCDLMNLLFLFDDRVDLATVEGARELCDALLSGMREPDNPQSLIIGELARQFGQRASWMFTPESYRVFTDQIQFYLQGIQEEAKDRLISRVRSLSDYSALRRRTVGMDFFLVLLQIILKLPPVLWDNPKIRELDSYAINMIAISNDAYSYNVEQARGDGFHNFVTVVQKEFNTSLDGAFKWIGEEYDRLAMNFLAASKDLSHFSSEYREDVQRYVCGLVTWVGGNDTWHFESDRYFGDKVAVASEQRTIALLPRRLA